MTVLLKIIINGKPTFLEVTPKPIVLGRSENSSYTVKDQKCSSTHCEIRLENGMTVIKDLGSKNGTFVNENIIKECTLYIGDEGRMGDTKFSLETSKMTPEEVDRHTSSVSRTKTTMIELSAVGFDKPEVKKTNQAVVHSASSVEKAKKAAQDEDSTKTSLFQKIVDKIKS